MMGSPLSTSSLVYVLLPYVSLFILRICFQYFSDDGLIDQPDLREVMRACMVENGMHFDEKEVSDLANALFDDAVKVCVIILNMQMCKTKRNI